jgi:hypothetical protein
MWKMDWLKGTSTGNHGFSHEICFFFPPLNQSIECGKWMNMDEPMEIDD